MIIEEEEVKPGTEVNPDALEAIFEDESSAEESEAIVFREDDEEVDEIDIAFLANDEGYW